MIDGTLYQHAYVTTDLDRAVRHLRDSADVRSVIEFEGSSQVATLHGPTLITCGFALVWVGDLQYEFIHPLVDLHGLYTSRLPAPGQLVQFHHAAYRVEDWDVFRGRVNAQPFPVAIERAAKDGPESSMKFLYLDARALLGHHVEYVWARDDVWAATGGR